MNEIKIIIWSFIFIVLGGIVLLDIMFWISAKMKNKAQKRTRKQITHRYAKIDLCEYLTSKMKQEYIGQKKAFINQLVRM